MFASDVNYETAGRQDTRSAAAGLMLVLLVLLLVAGGRVRAAQSEARATVYQTVNVRSGADTRYPIVGQLAAGDPIVVDGRDSTTSRWLRVRLPDGASGWVPTYVLILERDPALLPIVPTAEATAEATASSAGVRVVAYGRVNVRSGPGIDYEVVAQLDTDDEAAALARSSEATDWLYIENEAVAGWVAYFTVNVYGLTTALPVRVPDANGEALIEPSRYVTARFNTRLRAEPDEASAVLAIVPFGDDVLPLTRSADSVWVYVAYGALEGWTVADLLDLTPEQLATLPLDLPTPTFVPGERTPLEAETTATPAG